MNDELTVGKIEQLTTNSIPEETHIRPTKQTKMKCPDCEKPMLCVDYGYSKEYVCETEGCGRILF